ncbi:MAG: alpha/beta hydrolase [Mycetocola sp.]
MSSPRPRQGRPRRHTGRVIAIGALALVLAIGAAFALSPWPSVVVIRAVFDRGAADAVEEMNRHAPSSAATELIGVPVGDARMDVYLPDRPAGSGPVPVVVWTHGGAWISGRSADVAPYLRILTERGYAAIAVDYTIAPEAAYPTPVSQVNDVLAAVVTRSDEWGINPDSIVLAGDSAGAQITAQLGGVLTSPEQAAAIGVTPAVPAEAIRGLILHCGVYDLDALASLSGILGWGFKTAMWAYSGDRDWANRPAAEGMSMVNRVTEDYPSVFISGGDADGLTASQSHPFHAALEAAGVPVTALFWEDSAPGLDHEYQFHLDLPEARQALEQTVSYVDAVAAG